MALKPSSKWVFAMVLLNTFATPLMLSSTNVALPAIASDLRLDAVTLSWVPMIYLMASAIFVLIFGRIADMVGRKRIFLLGTVSVILTSVLAALSVNGEFLLIARFLQGMGAAMLYSTQIAIVSSIFSPQQRGRAIGITVSTIYFGLACGPLFGGYLVDAFGWQTSFIFHIPLALIVLCIGLLKVPSDWRADEPGDFDFRGALLYGFSIICLCVGVSFLPKMSSFIFIIMGFLGGWAFFQFERCTSHPIFDVSLFFSSRIFTLSCLASFIMYTSIFANVVLVSFYLQYLKGMSASATGVVVMLQPLMMAAFSPLAGRLSDRFEPSLIASAGMLLTISGLIMLALMELSYTMVYLVSALMLTGLGCGLFSSPNANAIMGTVEKRFYGSATGSLATMRILGQMSSMALVALVFSMLLGTAEIMPSNYDKLEQAISLCFTVAGILCMFGLIFSLVRGKMHHLA